MVEKKPKVYAVRQGRACGIFTSWDECRKQVDGYAGARYKSFTDVREALLWLNGDAPRPAAPAAASTTGAHRAGVKRRPAGSTASAAPAMPDTEQDYIIYTDGSCLRNPDGPGGWAAVVRNVATGEVTELHDGQPSTTHHRMEITAASQARSLPDHPAKIALYTDSQYLKNGFTRHWVESWKRRGWKKADGQPVLNQPLWRALDELVQKHQVTFHWVKGHAENPYNNRCDGLAVAESRRFKEYEV